MKGLDRLLFCVEAPGGRMRNEVQPIAAVQGAPCANLEALGRIVGDDPQRLLEVTVQRGQAEWVDTRGVVRVSPLDLQTERKIAQTCQRVIAGEQEDGKHANTVLYCNVRCNVILTQCMEIMNSLHNAYCTVLCCTVAAMCALYCAPVGEHCFV